MSNGFERANPESRCPDTLRLGGGSMRFAALARIYYLSTEFMMAETHAFDPATAGWEIYSGKGLVDLVGPFWQRRRNGYCQLGLRVEERHLNDRGVVHGGTLLTMLDQALGVAAWDVNGRAPQATIQLDVQFVAAVQPGDFVEAEGHVVRQTRSLLFMQGTCAVGSRVVATASGIWKLIGK